VRVALLLAVLISLPAHAGVSGFAVYVTSGQSNETWHGQAKMTGVNIELISARSSRTDIGFVLTPLTFDQPKSWFGDEYGDGSEDVSALLGSLLLRRRFNTDSTRLQFYGETSIGPMWAEKPVPASTSRFNFATQFGAGVMLLPQSRFPIIAGYRFMHLSNGGYSPRNPGLNLSSVILGVRYRR
jgi:opacity protein-like surface antigen